MFVGVHNEMSEKRDCVTRDMVVKGEYDGLCMVGHAAAEYLIAFGFWLVWMWMWMWMWINFFFFNHLEG